MIHPTIPLLSGKEGLAYGTCLATTGFEAVFKGRPAHAGGAPLLGVNAIDAASLAYTTVGMLTQQIRPTDRINILVKTREGPANIIADETAIQCAVRSATFGDIKA